MKKNAENQTVSVLQMLNEDGEETDACRIRERKPYESGRCGLRRRDYERD